MFEERKIGIPAVAATYYPPDPAYLALNGLRASLTYIPLAVPARLALIQERWFPAALVGESRTVIRKNVLHELLPGIANDVVVPIHARTLNHRPPRRLDAGAIAFRLGGTWREMDWDIYHYSGAETGPDAQLLATVILERTLEAGQVRPRLRALARIRQAMREAEERGGTLLLASELHLFATTAWRT